MVNRVQIIQKLAIVCDKKVLTLRRSPADKSRPGTWDFVGGNVDDEDVASSVDDILIRALKREIQEEVGLDVGNRKIQIVYIDSGYAPEGHLVMWVGYKVDFDTEPNIKLSHEHTELKWATKDEFLKLDFGYARPSMIGQTNVIWP